MSGGDPCVELLRHGFVPQPPTSGDAEVLCGCGDGQRYSPAGHQQHVLAAVKPLVEAREREVMASVAGEVLDVVHTMATALARCPEPYRNGGHAALVFELAARERFGTDSTTRAIVGYELSCDHRGCGARVEADTLSASRLAAAGSGWAVALGTPGTDRLTDRCPAHGDLEETQL
jgi:hypothetical protein